MTGDQPMAKVLSALQTRVSPSGRGSFPSWTSPVRIRSAAPFAEGLRDRPVALLIFRHGILP